MAKALQVLEIANAECHTGEEAAYVRSLKAVKAEEEAARVRQLAVVERFPDAIELHAACSTVACDGAAARRKSTALR